MKANTDDTNSLFEKKFAKYPFNPEKTMMSDRFNKSFPFLLFHFFSKKSAEVLVFWISLGSSSMCLHAPSRSSKKFCNFVLGANLSECYTHITLKQVPHFFCKTITSVCVKVRICTLFYKQVFYKQIL